MLVPSGDVEIIVGDCHPVGGDHEVGLLGRLLEHLDSDRFRNLDPRLLRDDSARIGLEPRPECLVSPRSRDDLGLESLVGWVPLMRSWSLPRWLLACDDALERTRCEC